MTNLSNCIIEIYIGFIHCKLSRYGRNIMSFVDCDAKNLYTNYWTLKIRDSLFYIELVFEENIQEISCETRMHSSRMRTARTNSRLGECIIACNEADPLGVGLETPQVWAWRPLPRPDPSTSPLVVVLETSPARPLNFPPGCGPGDPLPC